MYKRQSLLRKAMEDYETKMFLAQAKNITLGDMLDMWVEEELKPGSLSDGTVTAYINTVSRIKKHPIGKRKLKTVTSDHLQSYMDLLLSLIHISWNISNLTRPFTV